MSRESWRRTYDFDPETSRQAPLAAGQFTRPDEARLRGGDVDVVRRLRPRLGDGGDRPGILRARYTPASCREDERHWLLVEDDCVLHATVARLQLGARTDAVGSERR